MNIHTSSHDRFVTDVASQIFKGSSGLIYSVVIDVGHGFIQYNMYRGQRTTHSDSTFRYYIFSARIIRFKKSHDHIS